MPPLPTSGVWTQGIHDHRMGTVTFLHCVLPCAAHLPPPSHSNCLKCFEGCHRLQHVHMGRWDDYFPSAHRVCFAVELWWTVTPESDGPTSWKPHHVASAIQPQAYRPSDQQPKRDDLSAYTDSSMDPIGRQPLFLFPRLVDPPKPVFFAVSLVYKLQCTWHAIMAEVPLEYW